jgi:hypothetical protein
MPEAGRVYEVSNLTAGELERARRELRASLALTRENSPARVPILTQLNAVEAELARRECPMNLTSGQQLLDLRDGLRVVLVADRADARVTRTGHAYVGVIEEDHLLGRNVQAGADERVDARIRLAEPHESP